MSTSEEQIAILASKRLKTGGGSLLPLQSMVQNALSNLSRQVSNDPQRRHLLLTDKSTATASITNSSGSNYADLSTLISSPQIMLEYLNYGTIFYTYSATFTSGNVDTSNDNITIASNPLINGDPVRFTTSSALPAGINVNTTYYVINASAVTGIFQITTTAGSTDDIVDITTTGTGTQTITLWDTNILQWLASPNIASMTSNIPFDYVYGWLVQNLLYVSGRTGGTLAFDVPFTPATPSDVPVSLQNDLVDAVVALAISAGYEPLTQAQK